MPNVKLLGRTKESVLSTVDVFSEVIQLPDPYLQAQFAGLVGLDDLKIQLVKEGQLLLQPELLDQWCQKAHGSVLPIVKKFHNRPPLIIFSGDVGTGKTTLANSFGDVIARSNKIPVQLMRLSLNARGSGAVGEMTKLISHAFAEVKRTVQDEATGGKKKTATIMIIDEADALAQSRENDQMHHEDRAGVNAIIRGIDELTGKRLPVIIIMCTNRADAMDPAIMRRAASRHIFSRPNKEQRANLLCNAFEGIVNKSHADLLSDLTGPAEGRTYGYTYSDFTQRLFPSVILDAFPDGVITLDLIKKCISKVIPTKPFNEEQT